VPAAGRGKTGCSADQVRRRQASLASNTAAGSAAPTGRRHKVVKVIVLLPRRADMSPEAFGQHLRETHLPLVTRLPGLRRLVVNWVLPDPNGSPPAYDAVAEDWFDDAAAMGAALASPEGQAVAADVPNYLDPSRFALLVVEEEDVPLPTGSAPSSAG
jgi:uncharacterized protein (TIGR02118 family)